MAAVSVAVVAFVDLGTCSDGTAVTSCCCFGCGYYL